MDAIENINLSLNKVNKVAEKNIWKECGKTYDRSKKEDDTKDCC